MFNHCTLHCVRDGYITAASTPVETTYGFVFTHCIITAAQGAKVYLGRQWRARASTIFISTQMSEGIRPEGWHNWGKPENEKTARYSEVGSTDPEHRVKWVRPLAAKQVERLNPS